MNHTAKSLLTSVACFMAGLFVSGCGSRHRAGGEQPAAGRDSVYRVTLEGESCPFASKAEYGVYVPGSAKRIRGVLVLQHGCTMEQFGITRPYDLQYRAFARKWDLAVLETALYGDCFLWRDPESGTAEALFNVLSLVGSKSGHPELEGAPFLLFGHSGGGYWTLGMLRDYPERVIALVAYSAAFDPQWDYPAEAARVPVLLRHAGPQDAPFAACEATAEHTFARLRLMDAPASIAFTAGQNHNFSYIRYMAIPFFESAMAARLPGGRSAKLKSLDPKKTWLGDPGTLELCRESKFEGDASGLCRFPDRRTALNWKEYVSTGTLADKTPPSAPYDLEVAKTDTSLVLTWKAQADVESGLLRFNIFKNNTLVGTLPSEGPYQTFDTNGDNTHPLHPEELCFVIRGTDARSVGVEAVNGFESVSKRTICKDF
ncbi:MAG: alpha/beta fold hydrolase [Candidatus Cryptobacteroides sp.]